MYKKIFAGLLLFGMFTIVLAACAIRDTASSANLPTVHMGGTDFIQHSITIPKGSMINLVDDAPSEHIIENGTYVNGIAHPHTEPGAPTVNLAFNGNDSAAIGPFNSAGKFLLYCTIHQNMNLTVIVQ
jgi:plastocyanin